MPVICEHNENKIEWIGCWYTDMETKKGQDNTRVNVNVRFKYFTICRSQIDSKLIRNKIQQFYKEVNAANAVFLNRIWKKSIKPSWWLYLEKSNKQLIQRNAQKASGSVVLLIKNLFLFDFLRITKWNDWHSSIWRYMW